MARFCTAVMPQKHLSVSCSGGKGPKASSAFPCHLCGCSIQCRCCVTGRGHTDTKVAKLRREVNSKNYICCRNDFVIEINPHVFGPHGAFIWRVNPIYPVLLLTEIHSGLMSRFSRVDTVIKPNTVSCCNSGNLSLPQQLRDEHFFQHIKAAKTCTLDTIYGWSCTLAWGEGRTMIVISLSSG